MLAPPGLRSLHLLIPPRISNISRLFGSPGTTTSSPLATRLFPITRQHTSAHYRTHHYRANLPLSFIQFTMSVSRPVHNRTQSDADWYIVEQHEANPLLDLGTQTRISVVDSSNESTSATTGDEEFSLVETARPSFAQVCALKSARSSVNPSPVASPILRVSTLPTSATKNNLLAQQKYGSEYTLKKSGKKYVVTKA